MNFQQAIKAAKESHQAQAVADIRARAQAKGLNTNEANTLIAGIPSTIVAMHDGLNVHFADDDAKTVADILKIPVGTLAGVAHCSIDSRIWNAQLERLNEAGLIVTQIEFPGD